MTLVVANGNDTHTTWLLAQDTEVPASWVSRCVQQREYLVALWDEQPVGFLRRKFFN